MPYTMGMTSVDADARLIQPDYETKPVTALRNVVIKAISFVNKGANGKRFFLFKNEEGVGNTDDVLEYSPLIKKYSPNEAGWEVAYCVIAEPNVEDKQKDVWTEEEIKKAAHEFIPGGGLLNFMHETLDKVGDLVENAVALTDLEIMTHDGERAVIKKGSWYIAVKPNAEVKKMMQSGKITGMSVQGSAQREPLTKSADTKPIMRGTKGPGIVKLQNILGIVESGEYDEATEKAFSMWMADKGVPGTPTVATLKAALVNSTTQAAPTAEESAPSIPQEAEKGVEDAYDPTVNRTSAVSDVPTNGNGAHVGPRPGSQGVDVQHISADSPSQDLRAILGQAIQEGNESLIAYLDEKYQASQVADLYQRDISHEALWFMVSKFIIGAKVPTVDENGEEVAEDFTPEPAHSVEKTEVTVGDFVKHSGGAGEVVSIDGEDVVISHYDKSGQEKKTTLKLSAVTVIGGAEVEKGSAGGSKGGHDPRKYGKIRFIVRSFGQWAGGMQRICVLRMKSEHPEVFKGNENAGCAWLKDQWMGTTHWRKGNGKIAKALDEAVQETFDNQEDMEKVLAGQSDEIIDAMVKAMAGDMGLDYDELEKELDGDFDSYLNKTFGEDNPEHKADHDRLVTSVSEIIRQDKPVEEILADIKEALNNKPAGLEGAVKALHKAVAMAAQSEDKEERLAQIDTVIKEFSSWAVKQKDSKRPAGGADNVEETPRGNVKPTFLQKGEDMDRKLIEEQGDKAREAVDFLASLFSDAGAEAPADVPAEVEKEKAEDEIEETEAPVAPEVEEEVVAETPAEDEAEKADDKQEIDEAVAEAVADGDTEVTEDELLEVVNYLVEELEAMHTRLASLEELGNKLDKVGELAKALDVTDRVDEINTTIEEISKKLDTAVSSDELEAVRKTLNEVARIPQAKTSIQSDVQVPVARQAIAKSANPDTSGSLWNGVF